MADYSIWTKVVTHPLGLGGFVMFLVFVILSKVVKKGRNQTITLRVFLSLAVVSLVGGLMIAWEQVKIPTGSTQSPGKHVGSVVITNNSGVVQTENISTNVNVKTEQSKDTHVGNVEIKSNTGDVHTGKIETNVTNK
jgi:disulfide bond formation protein DsbB